MSTKKLNVYPDSDFWPESPSFLPTTSVEQSEIAVYYVNGKAMIKLEDLRHLIPDLDTQPKAVDAYDL